jgi:GMP synthase (glutamine-hydrolysing)
VVREVFGRHFKIKLQYEDASALVPAPPQGVTDPERKRKIIGKTFIEVFQSATKRAGAAKFLARARFIPTSSNRCPSPAIRRR